MVFGGKVGDVCDVDFDGAVSNVLKQIGGVTEDAQ